MDPTPNPGGAPGASAAPAAVVNPVPDRYDIRAELGRGGMGSVYLAFDRRLRRDVALKVVSLPPGAGDEPLLRFRREAEAAARLSDPHVLVVYDVGCSDRLGWLTLEVARGGSVADRLAREGKLPLREALRLVGEASRGMACAHAHGVIHRDLKPENLLLDESGRVKVADFGIARLSADADPQRLTRTGQVMGTPTHMAPEQAEGDAGAIDVRADVYALGSILYELLTGRPPYGEGTPMEVLFRKLSTDPPPPRRLRPEIAADIETIVLAAMEREPARRYGNAGELGDEVARVLAGEAIRARPASAPRRFVRWVRRHRGLAAGVAVAAACLGIGGGLAVRESGLRALSDRQAHAARAAADAAEHEAARRRDALVGQLRNVSTLALTGVLELRRHGVAGANATFVEALERACRETATEVPDLAEPHFHLGRLRRALGREEEALALQDEALRRDPGFAPSLYERAVLCARGHDRAWSAAQVRVQAETGARLRAEGRFDRLPGAGGDGDGNATAGALPATPGLADLERADPELRRWRDEFAAAASVLAAALSARPDWRSHPASVLRVGPAGETCIEGLRLLIEEHRTEASEERLQVAVESDPRLEEAFEGLWRVAATANRHEASIEACTRGIAADAGYVPHWIHRAQSRARLARAELARGIDPTATAEAGRADADRALMFEATSVDALRHRAQCAEPLADWRAAAGGDPAPVYAEAIADLRRALVLDDAHAGVWVDLGGLLLNAAVHSSARGRDVAPILAEARSALERALALRPDAAEARLNLAGCRANLASLRAESGGDAEAEYLAAEAECDAVLALLPNEPAGWALRGRVRLNWAVMSAARGGAGVALDRYRRAIGDLDEAVRLSPNAADLCTVRGLAKANLHEARPAGSPIDEALAASALADFDTALRLRPDHPEALLHRAMHRRYLAAASVRSGRDPGEHLEAARADVERAVARNPEAPQVRLERGLLAAARAAALDARGGAAEGEFAAAAEDFEFVLRLRPADLRAASALATCWANLSSHAIRLGRDPTDALTRAVAAYDRILERHPDLPSAWANRGVLRVQWAAVRAARGEDVEPLVDAAIADLEQAVRSDPDAAQAWQFLGNAHTRRAEIVAARQQDADAHFEQAVAAYGRALEHAPGDPSTWAARGMAILLRTEARGLASPKAWLEQAASDLEECLRLREDQPAIRNLLATVRRMIEESR